MKINAKLNGVNHKLHSVPYPWMRQPFIVFGRPDTVKSMSTWSHKELCLSAVTWSPKLKSRKLESISNMFRRRRDTPSGIRFKHSLCGRRGVLGALALRVGDLQVCGAQDSARPLAACIAILSAAIWGHMARQLQSVLLLRCVCAAVAGRKHGSQHGALRLKDHAAGAPPRNLAGALNPHQGAGQEKILKLFALCAAD